ncbi:MAG: EamA family transporter, partial [Gammaproteobacteria bacterium]|nr:EamA family transporter [Gammaproteobacteria bacterium]
MNSVGRPVLERFAMLRLVAGAAAISFSGVFVKLVDVGPTASAFWRTLIGGGFLCLWLLPRGRRVWTNGPARKWLIAAGFVFAIDLFVWHKAILYLGVGLATLLG